MPPSRTLTLRNRQRARPIDLRRLRQIAKALLEDFLKQRAYNLGVYMVAAPEMTSLNETFLRHQGSTDVITFDYSETSTPEVNSGVLHGEIFICTDEALRQSRLFRTSWHSEMIRYLVHGVLHLRGYDDRRPAARRRMKQEEDRLVRFLSARFEIL